MDAPNNGDGGGGRKKKSGGGSPATHGQFMGDEFRVYMSRKIELQRKQIGLVLPPPPPSQQQQQPSPATGHSSATSSRTPSKSKRKRVRFSQKFLTSPALSDDDEDARVGVGDGSGGLSAVLSRLKERHGQGRKKKRKRRGAKSIPSFDLAAIEDKRNDDSSPSSPKRQKNDKDDARTQQSISGGPNDVITTKRSRPDLFFYGVVVLINGYTSPDTPTLTRMLQKHGGDVEKYETSRVTHIIASALSTAKALIYKRQRSPTPYVYPQWVVDSCREGRLLPYADYLIDEIKDESVGSKTVKSYFASPKAGASAKSTGKSDISESKDKSVAGSNVQDSERISRAWSSPSRGGDSNLPSKRATESHPKETGESLGRMPSSRPMTRTVGTDPDFLTSYFQNSRLSFIGSFQQRVTQKQQRSEGSASSPTSKRRRRPKKESERFVFHVDIDCFFAAVVLRKFPEYRGQPVAIGHGWKTDSHGRPIPVGDGNPANDGGNNSQDRKKSYSELSTCNYNARQYGVRKGMFLHQARQLCPNLIVLPYDYDGYEEVSSLVSDILHQHAETFDGVVEQVSCDEAYIEMYLSEDDLTKDGKSGELSIFAKNAAESIRADILAATECTASVGVGANKFLAKLATDKAKPDGSFVVEDCYDLLHGLKLRDLPGIGWKLDRKLQANHLESVQDVLKLGEEAKETLCSLLGAGNGQKLMNYIDGKDDRPVEPAKRKTIGAECNYGVRFDGPFGPDYMIDGLSKEVCKRMEAIGVKGGRKLTLKIMQRRADAAKEPAKFLGHGKCNSLSRTCDITGSCDDWKSISTAAFSLFEGLGIDKDDIRGVGIVLTKLLFVDEEQECAGAAKMSSWLQSGKKNTGNDASEKDEAATPSEARGIRRDDETDTLLVGTPPGRSPSNSLPRKTTTRSIDKSPSKVLPTENKSESPQSTGIEDDVVGEYALPSLSQIDEGILAQMPEDVQASVRRLRFANEIATAHKSGADDQRSDGRKQTPPVKHGGEDSIFSGQPAGEDEGGWALPPLSQIDEDEVSALPTPLREEILKQMHLKGSRSTTVPDSSVPTRSPLRKKPTLRTHQTNPGDGHLRQLSLKRMMKLASVKSGQDGSSISLSQLDDLPLELQLQIANNDEGPLRRRRQQTRGGARGSPHRTIDKFPTAQHLSDDDDEDDVETEPSNLQVIDLEGGDREGDFYRANILPLSHWMNERPDPSREDIDHVKEFFSTLSREKRIDDVASLLRTIKRRGDIWGRKVYDDLLDSIDNRLIASEGRRLDRSNL